MEKQRKQHRRNGWKTGCLVLAAAMIAMGLVWLDCQAGSLYTVRMYLGGTADRGGLRTSIVPQRKASFAHGSHDAAARSVAFDGATVRCASGYGPSTLHGAFASADVNALYDDAILTEDWPFVISAFKTGNNVVMDFYLSVDLPEDPQGDAAATLMVIYDGFPTPVLFSWTGRVGERIGFGIEV